MRKVVIAIACVVLLSVPALAAFEPNPQEVCYLDSDNGRFHFIPLKLIRSLLSDAGIDDHDLDAPPPQKRSRIITDADRVAAILDPLSFCEHWSCREGTKEKLVAALVSLNEYFFRHTDPIKSKGSGVLIRAASGIGLQPAAQFLRDPNSVGTVCVLPPKSKQQVAEEAPFAKAVRGVQGHVRVRAKASDLVIGRDKAQFKGLERASISATRDHVADSQTYAINGVVGYSFDKVGIFDTLIPFFSYKREGSHTDDLPAASIKETEGAGLSAAVLVPILGFYQYLQAYPLYTHDTQAGTELFSGNVNLFPDFPFPGVGLVKFLPNAGVSYVLNPQIKYIYSTVLNDNGDPAFREKNETSRLGGRIELTVFPESELLAGFSLFAAYEYLEVFEGPLSEVDRFELALNYAFPKQEYWALQLKYTDGYDTATLKEENQLTLGAGLKY